MPRKRGPRRTPHRDATRRGPSRRSHPEVRAEDQPLIVALREGLHDSPVSFGALVCQFFRLLGDDDLPEDLPMPTPAQFVETLLGVDIAETTNALHIIAAITEDELLAARIRRALPERRQPVSAVVRDFAELEVVDCLRLTDPVSDSEHVVLPLRWPDGTEATFMVLIDHRLGGAIVNVILGIDSHADQVALLRGLAAQENVTITPIPDSEARARVARALRRWEELDDPPEDDSWPALSAFLTLVLDRMPTDEVELGDHVATGSPAIPGSAFGLPPGPTPGATPGFGPGFTPGFVPAANTPIALPDPPATPGLATLRIELVDTEPVVWRRVAVRSDLTLDALADIVNATVGWAGGHLHRFWPGGPEETWRAPYFVTEIDVAEGETGTLERRVRIDQTLEKPGDTLRYVYDFGDDWQHLVTLESVAPLEDTDVRALCLDGERAGPLEDVGGPPTHNELVETLAVPYGRYLLPDELREWLPEGYDPAEFSVATANLALRLETQSPEEVLAALRGSLVGSDAPRELAPGLESALRRLPIGGAAHVLARLASLIDDDPTPLTTDERRVALAHVQVLLDEAGEDGIPLTQAGWIKPDIVVRLVAALGVELSYGKGNRENQTPVVGLLREGMVEVGLLRKHKGRLLVTAAGRAGRDDTDVLWRHLTARLAASRQGHVQEARALYLLEIAAGVPRRKAHDQVTRLLTLAGWRTDDSLGVAPPAVYRATDATRALLGQGLLTENYREPEVAAPAGLRRLARDAVALSG